MRTYGNRTGEKGCQAGIPQEQDRAFDALRVVYRWHSFLFLIQLSRTGFNGPRDVSV
jgi:hypothetical protein